MKSIRITKIMIGILGAIFWIALASCNKDQETVTPDEGQPGQPTVEDIEAQAEFKQQRQEFVSTTEQMLQELDRAIEDLEERGSRLEGDRRTELGIRIQTLKDGREQFARRFEQAKQAKPDTWEAVKQETEQTWNEVEESYNDALSYLQTSEAEQGQQQQEQQEDGNQ